MTNVCGGQPRAPRRERPAEGAAAGAAGGPGAGGAGALAGAEAAGGWERLAGARRWRAGSAGRDAATTRSATDGGYADLLYTGADSDRRTVEAVGAVAAARGVSRAQVALAWLRRHPAVAAPLVGANTTAQIDDAVASLELDLTDAEADALEAHYTPRHDFQAVSDDRELARIMARIPGYEYAAR